jgi:hypothetical protein
MLIEYFDKPSKSVARHLGIGKATPEVLEVFMLARCETQRNLVPRETREYLVPRTDATDEIGTVSSKRSTDVAPFGTDLRVLGEKCLGQALECAVELARHC